jgi:POT family proton-dependent oligopeptide transporter
MLKYLLFSTEKAGDLYGWYIGILGFSPILGGLIADIWLGQRKTLIWSVVMAILGCVFLAASSLTSSVVMFYIALLLMVIGSMLFKPTIYTTLGNIYEKRNDPRRDGGFTLTLVAINIGAFLAPLICGILGENIGWWLGFTIAGIFMASILFLLKYTPEKIIKGKDPKASYQNAIFIMLLVFLAVYLPYSIGEGAIDQTSLAGIIVGSFMIPASWMQAILLLPSFIFYLIFPWVWIKLAKMKIEPATMYKFVWGLAFLVVGIILFQVALSGYQRSELASLSIIGVISIAVALSEVLIGPIIISLITRIVPKKWANTFVGAWFTITRGIAVIISLSFSKFNVSLAPILIISVVACGIIVLVLLRAPFRRWVR